MERMNCHELCLGKIRQILLSGHSFELFMYSNGGSTHVISPIMSNHNKKNIDSNFEGYSLIEKYEDEHNIRYQLSSFIQYPDFKNFDSFKQDEIVTSILCRLYNKCMCNYCAAQYFHHTYGKRKMEEIYDAVELALDKGTSSSIKLSKNSSDSRSLYIYALNMEGVKFSVALSYRDMHMYKIPWPVCKKTGELDRENVCGVMGRVIKEY